MICARRGTKLTACGSCKKVCFVLCVSQPEVCRCCCLFDAKVCYERSLEMCSVEPLNQCKSCSLYQPGRMAHHSCCLFSPMPLLFSTSDDKSSSTSHLSTWLKPMRLICQNPAIHILQTALCKLMMQVTHACKLSEACGM